MCYFHTPALRGTRSAQAVRSFRAKSLPSADGRRFAVPAAVGKRVDTCGFYPLNSRFPLFLSLAQTRDRRPLRKGERQRIFSTVGKHSVLPCRDIFAVSDSVLLHRSEGLRRRNITVLRNPLARCNAQHLRIYPFGCLLYTSPSPRD